MHTILQPEGWAKPVGYANGVAARGRLVFVGGQVGWTGQAQFETDDLVGQVRQTLAEHRGDPRRGRRRARSTSPP